MPLVLKAELGAVGGLIGASAAALALLRASVGGQQATTARCDPADKASATTAAPPLLMPTAKTDLRPGLAPDVMEREIGQTVEAVRQTFAELQHNTARRLRNFLRRRDLILLGTGASLAMARCAEALWTSADLSLSAPRRVVALEAAEALFGESPLLAEMNAAVVIVSKSGKSPKSLEAAETSRRAGNRVIAITSNGASPLAAAASDVVLTPIGDERGAATKSETAALAALLVLTDLIPNDPYAVDRIVALLRDVVTDEISVAAAGSTVGVARRIWTAGFGAGRAVADALALLLHEKARLPAIAASPSGFRHGFVEASGAGDSLVVIEIRDEQRPLATYFDRMAIEGQQVGLTTTWIAGRDRAGLNVRLRGSTEVERAFEAVVRAQQLAHAAALSAGTYLDGFRVLGTMVPTNKPYA